MEISRGGVKRVIRLAEYNDGSWRIDEETAGGDRFPTTLKPSARAMVGRIMQLVDVGPMAPQTTAERVGVDVD